MPQKTHEELLEEFQQQQLALANEPQRVKADNEVHVIVWKNHVRRGNFGHAAMKLRHPDIANLNYISWWPGEGAGKGDAFRNQGGTMGDYYSDRLDELSERSNEALLEGRYQPREGQRLFHHNDDTFDYAQQPTKKIYLVGLGVRRMPWGLDTKAIHRWWTQEFLTGEHRYQLASRTISCAGVVRQALKAGGAKAFADAPDSNIMATPAEMMHWGEAIDLKLNQLNNTFTQLMVQAGQLAQQGKDPRRRGRVQFIFDGQTLPTADNWRRGSRRTNGRRGQNVESMDSLITSFHNHAHETAHPGLTKKLTALVSIFEKATAAIARDRDPEDAEVLRALAMRAAEVAYRMGD